MTFFQNYTIPIELNIIHIIYEHDFLMIGIIKLYLFLKIF